MELPYFLGGNGKKNLKKVLEFFFFENKLPEKSLEVSGKKLFRKNFLEKSFLWKIFLKKSFLEKIARKKISRKKVFHLSREKNY